MKELIKTHKWEFEQFIKINNTAKLVYSAVQGGVDLNFFKCHKEYEEGRFGWIKEANSFEVAIKIYEEYTGNDGWDVYSQILETFEGIDEMEYSDLKDLINGFEYE